MLIFHLKKIWFDKIKAGEKTHEYRELTSYWVDRITKLKYFMKDNEMIIALCCGYPAGIEFEKDKSEKIIYAKVKSIDVVDGQNTDLKVSRSVYDIHFEKINREKK